MTLKPMKIVNTSMNSWILMMLLAIFCMDTFLCIYKMYLISAEGYKNAHVEFLTIKTTSEIWVNMKDVGSGVGVKNKSNLVLKEIYDICETKNSTKKTS